MPAEVMDMFREAQQNILELNRSRLVALEELQLARARIEDLEERCVEAERKAAEASALLAQNEAGGAGAGAGAAPPSVGPGVTLRYVSGWEEAYVHYAGVDGKWTAPPGAKMTKVAGEANVFELALPTHGSISFVVNNGQSDYDQPGKGEGANYSVSEPGTYTLQSGTVTKDA